MCFIVLELKSLGQGLDFEITSIEVSKLSKEAGTVS